MTGIPWAPSSSQHTLLLSAPYYSDCLFALRVKTRAVAFRPILTSHGSIMVSFFLPGSLRPWALEGLEWAAYFFREISLNLWDWNFRFPLINDDFAFL